MPLWTSFSQLGFLLKIEVATNGAVQLYLLFSTKRRVAPIEISAKENFQITVGYSIPIPKRITAFLLLFHGIVSFGMNFTRKGVPVKDPLREKKKTTN